RHPLSPARARQRLAEAPGVIVIDDPPAARYPLALEATERDDVLVGRSRRDPGHERAHDKWIVADNQRKGAATNAVQLAEQLDARGLVSPRGAKNGIGVA
ncbi:MAG: Asd/ArgC dimerization domain-containing protein, partial [Solirubrobacterales bacterium]